MYINVVNKYHVLKRRNQAVKYLLKFHNTGTVRHTELLGRLEDIENQQIETKDLLQL